MSGINSLPGGGKDFSVNKFKSKLSYLSKNGGLSALSDNQTAIAKAVAKYQSMIRSGSLGKSQQSRMINHIKHEGDLNSSQLSMVKKIVGKLGETPKVELKKSYARINRADDNEKYQSNLALSGRSNLRSGLSDVSSPRADRLQKNRSLVSIGQRSESQNKSSLSNNTGTASTSPSRSNISLIK